jgi:hypothetical protein
MFAYGMTKKKKELSVRVRDAYDTSYRAAIDDTSDEVVEARKQLRRLRTELKKKLTDVTEICEAATVVDHPVKARACDIASVVRSDYVQLLKELARIRKPAKSTKPSKSSATKPRAPKAKKPMSFAKAANVLKKHNVIKSKKDLMKRGNAAGGFLLGRL